MTTPKILVVDDERNITDLVSKVLQREGYAVTTATSGRSALEEAKKDNFDLVILDVMMPGMDGFETAKALNDNAYIPVIFLTARSSVDDRVEGLEVGGEDYITKPFLIEELTARVKGVLRRTLGSSRPTSHLVFGDITLDEETHKVTKDGTEVSLSPTEFALLRYFMRNPNRVLSKNDILEHVWDDSYTGERNNVVESYISYLRKKIDTTEPPLIYTRRGVGYILRKN